MVGGLRGTLWLILFGVASFLFCFVVVVAVVVDVVLLKLLNQ